MDILGLVSNLIGDYYGLDWVALCCGVTASYLISNAGRLYTGLCFSICGCSCGFMVALMSGQNGFILFNLLLICINSRGLYLGYCKRRAGLLPMSAAE